MRSQALILIAALAGALALAGPASAQAPITFAGQGGPLPVQTASVEPQLAGGGEHSYGYGAARAQAGGEVIDLRRAPAAAPPPQAQPVVAEPQVAEQGAAPWLERERVGPPYEANGRWYVPTPEPGYEQTGTASWYGPQFHGQRTASGEPFDQEALTAAHPTLPIPSLVQVTNLENGREVIVRVNDRGPFVGERLIDLSRRSADVLGFEAAGQARVHIRYLGPAPRHFGATPAPAMSAPPAEPARRAATDGPVSLLPDDPYEAPAAAPQPPQAPAFAPPPSGPGAYFVQVGAFSDLDNAHRVRAEIAAAGPVAVDTRQTASGELFRVRLGPYADREQAESARRSLAGLGYGDAILAAR